jgi:hypothetical protein
MAPSCQPFPQAASIPGLPHPKCRRGSASPVPNELRLPLYVDGVALVGIRVIFAAVVIIVSIQLASCA